MSLALMLLASKRSILSLEKLVMSIRLQKLPREKSEKHKKKEVERKLSASVYSFSWDFKLNMC